jgi:hypothetical protein
MQIEIMPRLSQRQKSNQRWKIPVYHNFYTSRLSLNIKHILLMKIQMSSFRNNRLNHQKNPSLEGNKMLIH